MNLSTLILASAGILLTASCRKSEEEIGQETIENILEETKELGVKYTPPSNDLRLIYRNGARAEAMKSHKPLTYRKLWEALRYIDGEGDSVRLIYSRELRAKDKNGGAKGDWNREHVWPRSYGIGRNGADYTDLHAIFSCDVSMNSSRGNKFFDEGSTDRDSWQPTAEIRGDIARAMFYMAVRYNGTEENTTDLRLSDTPDSEKGKLGKLSTLLKWHELDPVSSAEIERHKRIVEIQGNVNPFIKEPDSATFLFKHCRIEE